MSDEHVVPSGYDREEQHFHQKDLELLAKKRAELDASRTQRAENEMKKEHWLRCPKCGHDLEEIDMEGVMVDRCTNCNGLWFDAGEVEIMLSARRSWKDAAMKLLGR